MMLKVGSSETHVFVNQTSNPRKAVTSLVTTLRKSDQLIRYLTNYPISIRLMGGRDSSVGIATRYGLYGAGMEFRWGRDFPHPSRPALGPTQPPAQWIPGLSRG